MLSAHSTLSAPDAPPSIVLALRHGLKPEADSARDPKAEALTFTVDQCCGRRPSLQSYDDHDAKPDPPDASWSTPAQPAP